MPTWGGLCLGARVIPISGPPLEEKPSVLEGLCYMGGPLQAVRGLGRDLMGRKE